MKQSTKMFLAVVGILLFVGLGAMVLFLLVLTSLSDRDVEVITGRGDRVAVVELQGPIVSSDETVRQIKKFREDRSIKAVLFRVESPGGGVVASQEIYHEVRKTREAGKPIVVSMGSVAASGGYYVSCGADMIVANAGTLTGSIGVISQFLRIDPLLDKIGVEANTIKSGRYKDAGSPFRSMSKDDRAYFQRLMDDVHRQFISVVEQERDLDHDSVLEFSDGRVFTGEQALAMGLVDTIGTFEDAVRIVARLANIKGEPSIVKERKRGRGLLERILGETGVMDVLGLKDEILNQPILQYRLTTGY